MNYKIIFHTVGRILQFEAIIFIIPLIISIIYGETLNVISFLVAAAIALAIGFVLTYNQKGSNDLLFEKEGFAIVAIA
ncbi:MAG: TrkH family potassium uptake protein, partial [Clostridia bacterium]|nr:TrkH family potassium uptake protein [Clostridia bacterium]